MPMILKSLIPVQTPLSLKLKTCWRSPLGCPHSTSNSSYPKQNTPSPPRLPPNQAPASVFLVSCLGGQHSHPAICTDQKAESHPGAPPSSFLHIQSISASNLGPPLHLTCHLASCESGSPSGLRRLRAKTVSICLCTSSTWHVVGTKKCFLNGWMSE